jgi:hypothetical protein
MFNSPPWWGMYEVLAAIRAPVTIIQWKLALNKAKSKVTGTIQYYPKFLGIKLKKMVDLRPVMIYCCLNIRKYELQSAILKIDI